MQPHRATAHTGHEIPDRPAIRIQVGQIVAAGERDTQWPEFVFITCEEGAGWVPARYLSGDSGPVIVHTPYDTTELPVVAGQEVAVL
ncbi:MAG: hypothetical protein QNJ77_15525, partial [Acidimicrobiia bacterium]|nr:hypothetical protein [Acidimicrobiia bacterium]